MMHEPIEHRRGQNRIGEHLAPEVEGFVTGQDDRAALVPLGYDAEDVVGDDFVERRESQFIDLC